jgi:hypothetical protein
VIVVSSHVILATASPAIKATTVTSVMMGIVSSITPVSPAASPIAHSVSRTTFVLYALIHTVPKMDSACFAFLPVRPASPMEVA